MAKPRKDRYPKYQPEFLRRYDMSEAARWTLGYWFGRWGYDVKVPFQQRAGTWDEATQCRDEGDLYIHKRDWPEDRIERVEVKRITERFSCVEDWPKRYGDRFIICRRDLWDSYSPKPWAVVVVSSDWRHAAVAWGTDFAKWWPDWIIDKKFKPPLRTCVYFCLKSVVKFFPVCEKKPK